MSLDKAPNFSDVSNTVGRKAWDLSHGVLGEEKLEKVSYSFYSMLPSLMLVKLFFLPNIKFEH